MTRVYICGVGVVDEWIIIVIIIIVMIIIL